MVNEASEKRRLQKIDGFPREARIGFKEEYAIPMRILAMEKNTVLLCKTDSFASLVN